MASFIAGSLVHTREGLVKIETLRVGDWVSSQPEMTGKASHKRIVRTVTFEDKELFLVRFYGAGGKWPLEKSLPQMPHGPRRAGAPARLGLGSARGPNSAAN